LGGVAACACDSLVRNARGSAIFFQEEWNMRHRTSCLIEPLKGRALLSSVVLSNGTLTITGNSTADRIEVQRRADKGQLKVEINGSERKFTYSAVKKIVINAPGGNDFGEVSGRDGGVSIPMSVNGGDGNDTLHGGNDDFAFDDRTELKDRGGADDGLNHT